MATWQTHIEVVPDHDLPHGWKSFKDYEPLCQRLTSILAEGNSWHEELRCWGSDRKHEIALWTDEEETDPILIRIDLREDFHPLIEQLAQLLGDFNLKIKYRDSILEPTRENMMTIVLESNACRFVADPLGYIRNLSRSVLPDKFDGITEQGV